MRKMTRNGLPLSCFLRDIGYVKLRQQHLPTSYSPGYDRFLEQVGDPFVPTI